MLPVTCDRKNALSFQKINMNMNVFGSFIGKFICKIINYKFKQFCRKTNNCVSFKETKSYRGWTRCLRIFIHLYVLRIKI